MLKATREKTTQCTASMQQTNSKLTANAMAISYSIVYKEGVSNRSRLSRVKLFCFILYILVF